VLLASSGVRFAPGSKVYYRAAGSASLSYIGNSDRKRDAQWLSMQMHVSYLQSLEDSPRTRAACVRFLQNWMVYFYPERPDLFDQAQALAARLNGQLHPPRLSWKYSWIKALFGWQLARRAQRSLPHLRWSLIRIWDKTAFRLAGGRGVRSEAV
jgi:hypothetical protein